MIFSSDILRTTLLVTIWLMESESRQSDIIRRLESAFAYPQIDFPQLIPFGEEYDFIIVGCGTSGSLLANRLTQVPSFRILCIEAGDKENAVAEIPSEAPSLARSEYNWQYKTTYQESICEGFIGKVCDWPRGKALGGSSVINYMIYTRANRKDFDYWSSLGNYGWSFDDISHYYKTFENYRNLRTETPNEHGYNGELDVVYPGYVTPSVPFIIKSAIELGIPYRDTNGKNQIGITRTHTMIREGRRLSAASAFLFPIRNRPNLHVVKNSFVTKILIDHKTKTARGVEVSIFNSTYAIMARKEVIISAGSVNSPQLLMLSGVGPKTQLEKFGIEVIQDLPVGKYLKDHVRFSTLLFLLDVPLPHRDPSPIVNYLLNGKGPNTIPAGTEALIFFNTRNESQKSVNDVPDMELLVIGLEENAVEKFGQTLSLSLESYNDIFSTVNGRAGFSLMPVVLKPKSTGKLELGSTDPFVHPKIYSNYLEDEADLETMLRGVRKAIEIASGEPLRKLKPKLHEFKLRPCAKHVFNSDAFWKCTFKLLPSPLFHPVGTCKMGPRDSPEAVVDPELRVNGINKLRVVDASIMPTIPAAHTAATCYVIAEKAADLIKATYGVLGTL